MRRLLLLFVPLFAASAGAQIVRRPQSMYFTEPAAWVSFGAALAQSWTVHDGSTGSVWQFGSGTEYSASLEKTIAGGTTLGLRGMTSRAPLLYTGPSSGSLPVDADANVSQLLAVLHVASGRELHSVLELSLGATLYSNFRARGSDVKLAPDNDTDFTFGFGYGLGYNFSPTFAIDVVQDLQTTVHQKTGLSAGEDTTIRINSTRLIARFGLGSR
ncbi:MAG TPA: hypothetical protein VGG84_12155 [Gemmatimonadaceae bacterium]